LIETASKALNAQLTPMAKTKFNRCLEKSHNLFNQLSQHMETLKGLNKEQSNELLTAINADMIQAREAVGQFNFEIDEQKRNTQLIEAERKTFFGFAKQLKNEWDTETPGKPSRPSPTQKPDQEREPSPNPKNHTELAANRKVNRENIEADRKYREKHRNFEIEVTQYVDKLFVWKVADQERRKNLNMQMNEVENQIRQTNVQLKDQKSKNSEAAKSYCEAKDKLNSVQQQIVLHKIASNHIQSPNDENKSPFRPSNLRIIDFAQEATRLKNCLQELK